MEPILCAPTMYIQNLKLSFQVLSLVMNLEFQKCAKAGKFAWDLARDWNHQTMLDYLRSVNLPPRTSADGDSMARDSFSDLGSAVESSVSATPEESSIAGLEVGFVQKKLS